MLGFNSAKYNINLIKRQHACLPLYQSMPSYVLILQQMMHSCNVRQLMRNTVMKPHDGPPEVDQKSRFKKIEPI